MEILDTTTGVLTPFRVGINPTALAYNFASSTLVTLNQLSQTMTVVDYLARQVRAVFPVTPSSQFGVDIHPQTNLAVVADSIEQPRAVAAVAAVGRAAADAHATGVRGLASHA